MSSVLAHVPVARPAPQEGRPAAAARLSSGAAEATSCLLFGEGRASSTSALRPPSLPVSIFCLLCLAALAGGTGCGASSTESRGPLHYTEDAKRAYDKAMIA